MIYSKPTFTINRYDKDGDIDEKGIYLHYGDTSILISDSFDGFKKHIEYLKSIEKEIEENNLKELDFN